MFFIPLPEEESEYGEDAVDLTRGDWQQELPEDTYIYFGVLLLLLCIKFLNVFIIRQAHLLPNVPKQANFRSFLRKSRAEIANLLTLRCDKTIQGRELIFCRKVPSSSKHKYTVLLKTYLFELMHYWPSQNPYLYFFCECAKKAQRHKIIKTKARYENSAINLKKEVDG